MSQPGHISALPHLDESALDDELKGYYQKCREKLGFVPQVIQALSLRPQKLKNFIQTYNELMLGKSGLSKLEREMIAVVVSACNRCYYCLVAHGQAVRQLANDPQLGEMMVMNYRVAHLEPRQRAMLDFAWKLTESPELVGEADRAALRQAGFAPEDIFDICDVVAFFNASNRLAHGIDMMPNAEYHAKDR